MAASFPFGETNKEPLEPLSAAMLEGLTGLARADIIGIRVFPIVERMYPMWAGKITGMIIQLSNAEVLELLKNENNVAEKAHEAMDLLRKYLIRRANLRSTNTAEKEKFD